MSLFKIDNAKTYHYRINELASIFSLTQKEARRLDEDIRILVTITDKDKKPIESSIPILFRDNNITTPSDSLQEKCSQVTEKYLGHNDSWVWQEDLFCVLAYVFSAFSFIIDILDINNIMPCTALAQFGVVFLLFVYWQYCDCKHRYSKSYQFLFMSANRIMPCLTMVTYLIYHSGKLLHNSDPIFANTLMICILLVYVLIGICLTIQKYLRTKHIYQIIQDKTIQEDLLPIVD